MSRKWERMIEKNQKNVNVARKKQGVATIQDTMKVRDADFVIKGRSWMFPSILVLFALMFFFTSPYGEVERNSTFWFTGFSYIGLGILMYLIRRPVIRVSKSYITVRRFSGDKLIEPKDIEEMTLNNGHIIIVLKNKKKFMYTRFQHRFPMDTLNGKLRDFAVNHKVTLKDEAK